MFISRLRKAARVITEIKVNSGGRGVYDITLDVEKALKSTGLKKGIALLYSVNPLCRLITIEYDGDLIEDLMTLIDGLKAKNPYVIASIFQPSLAIPFEEGLLLGAFQQICLLDLNESSGERKVLLEVIA